MLLKKNKSPLFVTSLVCFISVVMLFFITYLSRPVAEWINSHISSVYRLSLLPVSNIFGFFLLESLFAFSPFLILIAIVYILRSASKKESLRRFLNILSLPLFFLSVYMLTVALPYNCESRYEEYSASESDLSLLLEYISEKINPDFESLTPEELADKLHSAYKGMDSSKITVSLYSPRPKLIKASAFASDMHILASYSFLTSEISLNPDAPEYMSGFSLAHEMAHLYGIASEAEANLYAYISSLESGDGSLIYSAYLNAFEFLGAELYKADPDAYYEIYSSLPEKAKRDIKEYNEFYSSADKDMSDISDKINTGLIRLWDKNGNSDYDAFSTLLIKLYKGELDMPKTSFICEFELFAIF